MKVRVISGAACAILMFGLVWAGNTVLFLGLLLIACIAYMEISNAIKVTGEGTKCNALQILSVIWTILYYCSLFFVKDIEISFLLLVGLFIGHMVLYVITYPRYDATQIVRSVFAFIYGPVLLSFILLTRALTVSFDVSSLGMGFYASWMIFICAWVCDTCAYFVGVLLGKHKAFPKLSPKKTIEGCVGGVLGSCICGALYGYILFLNNIFPSEFIVAFGVLGFLGSFVGMMGDLAASAVKRFFGIKDYGKIIPGHGGIMDRFDSITFTAPIVYMVCTILIRYVL